MRTWCLFILPLCCTFATRPHTRTLGFPRLPWVLPPHGILQTHVSSGQRTPHGSMTIAVSTYCTINKVINSPWHKAHSVRSTCTRTGSHPRSRSHNNTSIKISLCQALLSSHALYRYSIFYLPRVILVSRFFPVWPWAGWATIGDGPVVRVCDHSESNLLIKIST